jgi:TP901 family phage tail tape measure protein
MASAFNLTAQINLRGPSNVRNIVSDIRRQLGTITGDVNLRINPATTRNVTVLNTALTTLNNNLTTTTNNATNAANAIRQFGASIAAINNNTAGLNRNLNNAAAAANNAADNIGNAGRQTREASGQMVEFGRTAGLAVRRFAAFSMSAGAIMGLTNAMRQGIDAFIDYDKQFVKLQQVTGESASGLSQLSNTITQLSTSLGVSSKDLTEVSLTLAQAGLTARDTERALKALALSSLAPSFDNMNQTVEGSIALMRQFGISAIDLEKSLGAVNAVSAKFAVEASDIIAAIQRTGGVFASASKGVSEGTDALNEFIAVFTSVRATTRESAETIATGLRTIFTRIQRGGTIEALKEFGVNLTDAEGKFVGAYKAVQLLSEGLNQIDPRDLKFSEIVEELGGFRQIGKVIPLIQQFATAQDALRVAQQGQGSLTMDAAKAQASLANQAAKVREEFLALFREIGGSDTFQALAKGALGLASALISVADSVKGVLPVLAIMMAFRGASGVRQFGSGFLRGFRTNGAQGAKKGGFINKYAGGGDVSNVPVALTPGEAVFYPEHAARIGTSTLRKMNHADKNGYRQKRARGGGIGIVPGRGNTDSFYTTLPVGSFVIRKKATEALGLGGKGTQKFAKGGLAVLKSSRPYVPNVETTYDKKEGESIEKALKRRASPPLRFNTRDTIEANIRRVPINLTEQDIKKAREKNPVETENYINSRGATGSKGSSARGTAFERILDTLGKYKQEKGNRFSRIDGLRGNTPVEVKSKDAQVSTRDLLDKVAGSIISERSASEKVVADKTRSITLNKDPNNINIGRFLIFEDNTPGLLKNKDYRSQRDIEKTQRSLFYRRSKKKTKPEDVQKLMAGSFVKKGRGGRRANVRMNDWTLDEVSKIPSAQLPNQLGIDITEILKSAGSISGNTGMSANDIRTLLGPYSKNPTLKSKILSSLVVKANKIVEDRRNKDNEDTNNAISSDSLFGAIGMFGSSFPPTDIDIPGLDGSKKVRVFGQVLDKNNIEREARLAQMDKKDPNRASVEAAPTADQRAKKYTKGYLKMVGQGVQKSYVDEIIKLLDPRGSGLKAFFDFDKTLAFNTDPITEKQKEIFKKTGKTPTMDDKTSKAGMYSQFYEKASVARGLSDKVRAKMELAKTKPSALFRGLVRLSSQLKKKFSPADYNKFLSRLHIVTARPQSTVGSIASWVNSRGLNIPLSNFTGVGAKGTSAADIGLAKANVMAQALGQDKGVFVDDDPDNIAAASKLSGIKSFLYKKTKSSMGRATRKGIADTQGNAFEEEIRQIISKDPAAANIWTAMSKDSEKHSSIDFPYGIGSKIATNWFNNPLLARTPVDAKRTLTGPKGKIVSNIKNFIKSRSGYSEGDWVRGKYSPADIAARANILGMTPEQLTAKLEERLDNRWKDYALPDWDISKKLGLLPSKKIYAEQERRDKAVEEKRQRIQSAVERRGGSMGEYEGLTSEQKALRAEGYRPRLKKHAKGGYTGLANAAPDSGRLVSLMYKKDKTQQEMEELDLLQKRRDAIEKGKIRGGGRAYGKIGLYGKPEEGEVTAAFTGKLYEKERFGTVKANKIGPKLFAVSFANATKGFAPRGLYDTLMESVAESGGRLTSDRGSVTPAAKGVWKRYFLTRKDVFKTPLPKQYWTASNLLDPRLKGPKSEWPPYHGGPGESAEEASLRADAWALQSSYFKAPDKIKQKSSVVKKASGGEIPIMAKEGEYVINKNSAQDLGYNNLDKLNKGGFTALNKLPKYHSGGVVQKFARGSWEPLATAEIDPEAQRRREEAERRRLSSEAKKRRQEARRANAQSMIDNAASSTGFYNVNTLGRNLARNPEGYQILREKRSTVRGQARMRQIDADVDSRFSASDPRRERERSRLKRNTLTQMAVADTERKQQNQARFGKTLGDAATALGSFRQNLLADPLGALRDAARKTAKSLDDSATAYRKNRTGGAETLLGVRRQGTQARQAMDDIRGMTSDIPTGTGAFGRATRRVSVFGTSSADTAAMSGQSKADVAAAKKATLQAAGYGKGGAQATAIQAANRTAGVGLGAAAGMSTNQILAAARGGKNGSGSGGVGGGGGSGGGGGNMMGRAMTASFLIPMLTDMFSGGAPTTTSGAYNQTLTQGAATTVGSSLMMGSMVGEMTQGMGGIAAFAGPAAAAVTAVIGMTKAFIDAENAAREMAISLASKNLEASLETTGKAFEEFKKDMKNEVKQRVVEQQIGKSTGMADQVQKEKSRARRGFANLFDTGEGSSERSDILFEKGMSDYFSATFGGGAAEKQQKLFATMIPKKSVEAAKDYAGTAQISSQLIEEKIRSGTQIKDVAGTPDFTKLTRSLALADAAVQEQILNIQNSIGLTQEEKNAKKESIISIQGERKAREIQATTLKQMKLEELSKSANHLQNSLTRMFQNMEQAIGRNVFELNNLSQQAELSASALSGNAKAGQVSLKSINVLQNPNAYNKTQRAEASQNAANMFGSESGDMKGLLQAGGTLQDTIMSTINKTIKEDPNAGNEKIGIKIQNNIEEALTKLKLPKDINNKLSQEVNAAIGQIRQKRDEKIDFGDLMEKIPQLGNIMDSTRKAQEAAIKALEHWQNNLNDYSNAMNQMVESSIEANSRFRRASDIQVRGQMELDKALGKEISLRQQLDASLAGVKAQTGGQTNPALIAQNVRTLETQRATQQSMSNTAGQRGYAGTDEFMMMQDRLRNTNIALRENYDALKSMADNTEMASIAMSKINEIQQKRQAGVNMAERLVTSSPQELSQLNRAMDRLNNNMQGGINFGSSADQRKESLDAFNMIAPFLGEKQNGMKANVLESMLIESGVGINPMMADVLQSLRNPEGDPEMQEAITAYKKAVDAQSLANTELGNIVRLMNQNTAEIAAAKLVSAMRSVPFTFENAQLKDIANEIKQLRIIVEKNPAAMAPGKANGGIIYASAGQMVNFQPKGTDTVPAMLTPGEFVVNRSATQKHLPLLKNINSGNYSNGGKVKYYADGGYVVTGGFAPKDAAESARQSFARTSIVEKESNKEYPIINDDKPLSEDTVKSKTENWSTFQGSFYATEPVPRNDILVPKKGTDGKFMYSGSPTFNTMPVFGWGYDSIKQQAKLGQNTKDNVAFGAVNNSSGNWGWGGIPIKNTFDQHIFNPVDPKTRKIKKTEKPDVLANLDMIVKSLTEVSEVSGREATIDGVKVKLDTPSKVPSLNPSFTSYADGSAEIKGLASKDNSYYYFIRKEQRDDLYAKAKNSPVGNIIGFRADGFGREKNFPIVSGKENFIRKEGMEGGRFDFEGQTIKHEPPNGMANFSNVIQDYQTESIATLQLAQNIRLTALRYQDALLSEKFESETKESLGNKQNVSDLVNLYNGTVASIKLDKPVIEPSAMAGSPLAPITAYNEAISGRWTEYQAKLAALNTKKAEDGEQKFQYSDEEKTDMLGINKDGTVKYFRWTDANLSLDDYDEIFREAVTSPDMVQQPVIRSPGNYDKNGVKFSYIKYDPKSRLYLENEKRFGKSFEELGVKEPHVIIPPQGNDEKMRPFNPFLGISDNTLGLPESRLDDYVDHYILGGGTDYREIPNLSASNGIPYSPIYDSKFGSESFISNETLDLNLDEFFKAREANMEKIKNETALSYAKTDFSIGEYAKIDDAKKVTLAREFYRLARLGDDVPPLVSSSIGKEMTSVADIGNAAANIGSKIPTSLLPGNYERERIDAWRAVFAEIYNLKDTNSTQTLQDLGVNLSDESFPETRVVADPDDRNKTKIISNAVMGKTDLGEDYIKYWNRMNVSQDLLQKIINRQIMSNMTKRTSTKFIQTKDDKLKGDSYTFGTKGAGKVESAEQALPDSWNRLMEVALDPQRIFPNSEDRSELIDKLRKFYFRGKNEYGEDLLPDDLKKEKETRLKDIWLYFRAFDTLLNTGLKTGESDDKNAVIPWNENNVGYGYKYFVDSLKAISSDNGKIHWNSFAHAYKRDLNLENGRDTLHADQVEALIRASANLKEEQQKKNDQNQEGAGNVFSGVKNFATGGRVPVYAKNGTLVNYQPRGTDTVPAMLTPGEFVINRKATQKHLPVLKAINDGYYTRGGIVNYLSNGGIITPNYYETAGGVTGGNKMFDLSSYMGNIVGQISSSITLAFQNAVQAMSGQTAAAPSNGVSSIDSDTLNKIGEFTNRLKSVADTLAGLSAIPQEITITVTHTHNVIINGDAALNKLSPDLQDIAMSVIQEKFAELAAANQIAGSPLINPFQV